MTGHQEAVVRAAGRLASAEQHVSRITQQIEELDARRDGLTSEHRKAYAELEAAQITLDALTGGDR